MLRALLLIFLPGTCALAQKMLPVEAVPGMIDTLHDRIVELHPFAHDPTGVVALNMARTQVQGAVAEAVRERDSISLVRFKELAEPLQEVTGCGHLILSPFYDSLTYIAVQENYFPLHLVRVEDGRYLLKRGLRTTTDSLPPGTELTQIQGQAFSAYLESLVPFSGVNDQGNDLATAAMIARNPAYYYQAYYGVRDSLTLVVKDESGRQQTHHLHPQHRPYVNPKKNKTDINRWLAFRLSDDEQTGILTIRKFSAYEFHNGNYFRFIRSAFDSLRRAGVDQLVIDIRNNTGGSSGRINYLYHFLATAPFQFSSEVRLTGPAQAQPDDNAKISKRRIAGAVTKSERKAQKGLTKFRKPRKKKERFTGRVVVLINDISFSASGMFARFVQGSGRGQLVGTVAGAASGTTYGGSRKARHAYLGPDKNFELRVNTISLQLPYPVPGNVTPDVIVPVTEAGLRAGRDEQLAAALELVAVK